MEITFETIIDKLDEFSKKVPDELKSELYDLMNLVNTLRIIVNDKK